ncbi:hypothetical protein VSDG_06370 [Cytospora chrysosperma]|uniref:Uncharacterized protein n=1 Tax=Cytospora chrysosperma TaxID=252740 RepID=A0A423VPD2_CYTCH|nr:hypothetical protein VSDG_06370 [Valsa sordida]
MAIDPFTAIGAASAILSFIDFSWKLVAGAHEIYNASDGTSKDNANVRVMVGNLQALTENLGTSALGNSKSEVELKRLAADCNTLSKELKMLLQKLQRTGGKWDSVKVKLRSMRKKDEINSIRGRLTEYTSQITLVINTILLDQQAGIKSQLDSMQTVGSQSATTTDQKLEDIRDSLTNTLATALSTQQNVADLRGEIGGDRDVVSQQTAMLHQIKTKLDNLQDLIQVIPVEKRILEHVFFTTMFDREEAIHDAEEGTFAWLLEGQDDLWAERAKLVRSEGDLPFVVDLDEIDENQRGERKLAIEKIGNWLQHGSGVLHLSGKAGSGKSTAMELIVHHKRTRAELEHWAGDKCLVTSDHYFWSTGDEMQRSLEGLYRSILFDILRQCPNLIPAVFPEQWAALRSDNHRHPGSQGPIDIEKSLFRASKIKNALDRLVTEQLDDRYCICLFVDGLDEFEGDPLEHRQLAESFSKWSARPNVKCLLSSRPHPEFHQTFPEETRLHLHRLNERDIYTFSLHMFERDSKIGRMRSFYKRLVYKVVQNSEGVFLWAFLVVRILLGSAGFESERILGQTLSSLPKELGKLYQTLLESLDSFQRQRADKMLFLALSETQMSLPLSTLAYSWLDMLQDPMFPFADTCRRSVDQLTEQCDSVEQRIASLTKGLLEVGPSQKTWSNPPELLSKGVRFLHRTVADYLRCGGVLTCESTFNLSDAYWRLRIAEIAALEELKLNDDSTFQYMLNMFIPFKSYAHVDEPSHDLLKRADRETFTGQTMSLPHFLLSTGLSSYILAQAPSRPRTASAVSDLNLLLAWVVQSYVHSSDVTQQLLSQGFHFRDKVRLYFTSEQDEFVGHDDSALVPQGTGTVWIVFVAQLWVYIESVLVIYQDEPNAMWPVKVMLERLAVFIDNGADPDVVISFKHRIDRETMFYTSLLGVVRAVRREFPTIIDLEGPPWKRVLSGEDSTSRKLPPWAERIPGSDSQIETLENLGGLTFTPLGESRYATEGALPARVWALKATYFCTREECVPADMKFRLC